MDLFVWGEGWLVIYQKHSKHDHSKDTFRATSVCAKQRRRPSRMDSASGFMQQRGDTSAGAAGPFPIEMM